MNKKDMQQKIIESTKQKIGISYAKLARVLNISSTQLSNLKNCTQNAGSKFLLQLQELNADITDEMIVQCLKENILRTEQKKHINDE